ncbi:MAG: hypothetical protein GT597_13890 [Bacteroidales bacterium]|nr:hypothetical protein [Bacteroidales bacterium]
MIRYKLSKAPLELDILAEVRNNLRLLNEDHDALLTELISSAVTEVENHIGRQLLRATYLAYFDSYPGDVLEIHLGPVASVVAVRYYADGVAEQQTVDPGNYQLDNTELTARLLFRERFSPDSSRLNSIEIEFTCGWENKAAVPKDILRALILLVSEGFLNPGNMSLNQGSGLRTTAAMKLLRNYKVQRF